MTSPANADRLAVWRGFWRLAAPYWRSRERRLNRWSADFFNAIERKDPDALLSQIGVFAGFAVASLLVATYALNLKQLLLIRWRRWLTDHFINRWLGEGRHYRLT